MKVSRIILWGCILLIILLLFPLILKLPAVSPLFDLSNSYNLGTALSGMTSPVIGIISIILIYLAFVKQSEANGQLRIQNELLGAQSQIDLIFRMLDSINKDIDSFIYSEGGKITLGKSALLKLPSLIQISDNPQKLTKLSDHEFGGTSILIAGSYLMLFEEIRNSKLALEKKQLLTKKVDLHFRSYVGVPFFGAWLSYKNSPEFFDQESLKIIALVEFIFSEEERREIMIRGGIITEEDRD